jgi:hypothetical protein
MDFLVVVGTTALSLGCGLLLLWLVCTAFFALLMRTEPGEKAAANPLDTGGAHAVSPTYEP